MKRLYITLALSMFTVPALAGSLTIGLTSGPITGTATYAISDADAAKLLAFVRDAYPTRPNPAFDPACVSNPSATPPVTCPAATLTNNAAQSLKAWADGIVAGTTANVQNFQRAGARKTAEDAIAPIDVK